MSDTPIHNDSDPALPEGPEKTGSGAVAEASLSKPGASSTGDAERRSGTQNPAQNPSGNRSQQQRQRRPDSKNAPGRRRSGQKRPAQKSDSGKATPDLNSIDALGAVILRNTFYKDGYRTWMKIAFFEGIALVVCLVALLFVIMTSEPENRYFATTADGRLVRMVALAQPNLSDAALLSWVAQSATETMTFGFHDYKQRLQNASSYFTRKGWESFTQALQSSRIIEAVEARQQVVSAVPGSAPVIVQEGVVNGQYRWVVEMPLVVTYKSGSSSRPDSMRIRLTVVRVPTLDSPSGIGIEQWIAGSNR